MNNIPCVDCDYAKTEIEDIDIPTRIDITKLATKPVYVRYDCTAVGNRFGCKRFQDYLDNCNIEFDASWSKINYNSSKKESK